MLHHTLLKGAETSPTQTPTHSCRTTVGMSWLLDVIIVLGVIQIVLGVIQIVLGVIQIFLCQMYSFNKNKHHIKWLL